MFKSIASLFLLATSANLVTAHTDDLNFNDMGSFNPSQQKMIRTQQQDPIKNEYNQRCHDDVSSANTCLTFMRRSLMPILREFDSKVTSLEDASSSTITVDVRIQLSREELRTLQEFATNTDPASTIKNLPKVDRILFNKTRILSEQVDGLPVGTFFETFLHLLRIVLGFPKGVLIVVTLTVISLAIVLQVRRMMVAPTMKRIFGITFIVSCLWTYMSMVDEVIAKDRASLGQMMDIPKDCDFDNLGFVDSIGYFFRVRFFKYEDRCDQYHKVILMDPLSKVAPMEAVSRTVAQIFTSSFGYVGIQLSDFFSAFNIPQQILFTPTFPIFAVVIFLVIILAAFKFHLKTPMFSLGFVNQVTRERSGDRFERLESLSHPSRLGWAKGHDRYATKTSAINCRGSF